MTVDHTHKAPRDQRHQAGVALLNGSTRLPATAAGLQEHQPLARAGDPNWQGTADLYDLAVVWRTGHTHGEPPTATEAADRVEQRLRQLYPEAMARYDDAVRAGAGRDDAMQVAAPYLPGTPGRPGDTALTSSVRGGPIGINRIDLPVTQILLAGRELRGTDPRLLREAVDHNRPATAIDTLRRLVGTNAVAVVVRPRPDQARDAMTAARLARQDQADTAGTPQAPLFALPGRPHPASLTRAPATPSPTR